MTHTPGPWRIIRRDEYAKALGDTEARDDQTILSIDAADGTTVLYTDSGYYKPLEANARLIAAAPTLLAALEELCADRYLADPINVGRMAHARAAIALAKGEA